MCIRDRFYSSVEQMDNPKLKGKPVAVKLTNLNLKIKELSEGQLFHLMLLCNNYN